VIQRRLLTSMFGVVLAAIGVFVAGLEVVAVWHGAGSDSL